MTCYLKFDDGQIITGKVSTETPYDSAKVEYTGPIERLPRKQEEATIALLRLVFNTWHLQLKAKFEYETEGEFKYAE